jgi:UDP-N-acetylmuramate: L-alanyl-gamma-D-glutamyl-meso-diaminopimelate ligase
VGTWHGATVVEDFAHHPTAIALALRALRQKYPGRRLVACFEPRSNTTTRNLFQRELAEAFAEADAVLIGALDRPLRYTDAERLNTAALVQQWQAAGKQAWALPLEMQGQADWGGEVERVLREWVQPGDVVAVLTNGDFGGLRRRILTGCVVADANV